jgi:hypothetical protein
VAEVGGPRRREEVRLQQTWMGLMFVKVYAFWSCDKRRLAPGVQRSEGSSPLGRISRHELVCGRSVRILTMMQSYASATKLRAAGPFSPSASVPCLLPVPATSDRQSAVRPERQRERRVGAEWVRRCFFREPS